MQRAPDPSSHHHPHPRGRAARIVLAACVLAVTCLPLAACGRDRAPGGTGRLETTQGVQHLTLTGSPYELGWWHGHLLRDDILARVAAARRLEPADFIEAMADQALARLGERTRQELDGLAAATGAAAMDLLRTEVAREALRYRGAEAELLGIAGLAPTDGGFEARIRYLGPGAASLADDAIVIERRPTGQPHTVALTTPGSLGAWALLSARGNGYVLAEVDVPNPKRKGFGAGRPLPVMAREVLTATDDVARFTAELTGSMGHTGVGFDLGPRPQRRVRAFAGVQVYGAPELPWNLGDRPFLAVGPHGDPAADDARALQAGVVTPPDLALDARWLQLDTLGDPTGQPPQDTPRLTLRLSDGVLAFLWAPKPGAECGVALALED